MTEVQIFWSRIAAFLMYLKESGSPDSDIVDELLYAAQNKPLSKSACKMLRLAEYERFAEPWRRLKSFIDYHSSCGQHGAGFVVEQITFAATGAQDGDLDSSCIILPLIGEVQMSASCG